MHDETPVDLNLGNICGGAALERFEHLVQEVLTNIADENTPAEAKRSLTMKFIFAPTKDRKACQVTLETATKLVPIEKIKGSVFFRKRQGKIEAFTEDPRQTALFAKEQTPTPKQ